MAVLMREAIGDSLRRARTARRRTLRDVSRKARVSLGYLSEVERGRKEPSSELLAAICEALDLALHELLSEAAEAMAAEALLASAPVPAPGRAAAHGPAAGHRGRPGAAEHAAADRAPAGPGRRPGAAAGRRSRCRPVRSGGCGSPA